MNLSEWQTKVRAQLHSSAGWLRKATPGMAYGALATCTLLPLVAAHQQFDGAATQAIAQIFGGIGLNLFSQQLATWFGKNDEELATMLGEKAEADPAWRDAFDELLKQVETPKLAQAVLSEADWDRLAQLLRDDVQRLGSTLDLHIALKVEGDVSGNVVAATIGPGVKNAAVGTGITQTIYENVSINPPPADPAQRHWRRYLQTLRNQCAYLPLIALGDDAATTRIKLDDLYIDLDTTTARAVDRAKSDHTSTPESTPESTAVAQNRLFSLDEEEPLSALQATNENPWLVLLGDPGSGKSTFVRELVVRVIDAQLHDLPMIEGWSKQLFPLLTVLRDLAPRLSRVQDTLSGLSTEQRTQKLVACLREQWSEDLARADGHGLADLLDDALARGEVLLVLDGLDEMRAEERLYVRQAVMAVLQQYRLQQIIVTCRTYSYTGTAKLPEFADFTLASFDAKKIERFIQCWYQAQVNHSQLSQLEAETMTADLQKAALRVGLETMARNPMLLTTMAIIHRKQARLPDERVRLYREAVTIFISRWQDHKGIEVSAKLRTLLNDQRKTNLLLYEIAHKAHEQGGEAEADLALGDLVNLLGQKLDLPLAGEFLAYIDQRAGLLVGRGGPEGQAHAQQYAFAHRTFQEYLAGCYLLDDIGNNRGLIDNFWDKAKTGDYWQLAIILGAEELFHNRSSTGPLLELIYALSPKRMGNAKADWRRVLWSGLLATLFPLSEIENDYDRSKAPIGKTYLRRQRDRLVKILEKGHLPALERAEAGRVLAKLGDPRPQVTTIDQMEFCFVPAGSFRMGSKKGDGPGEDPLAMDRELPQHTFDIAHDYWLARYPLTNAQYDLFVQAGGYADPTYWTEAATHGYWQNGRFRDRNQPDQYGEPFDLPNHPVVGITWYEALAYGRWLTERLPAGWEARLPSEAEWEKGARGGLEVPTLAFVRPLSEVTTEAEPVEAGAALASTSSASARLAYHLIDNPNPARRYAWGDQIEAEKLNYNETNIGSTSAVGAFPGGVSPYGAEEMNGNVWEWCSTKYGADYAEYAQQVDNSLHENSPRVVRGGSFAYDDYDARASSRYGLDPDDRDASVGVRFLLSPSLLSSVPLPSGL